MSLALAADNEEELLCALWTRLFQMKRWPTEYRLFFLTAAARLCENNGITYAINSLARPRGLLSLARSYATTPADSLQAWALTRSWIERLCELEPSLELLAEHARALQAPPSLADCRRRYGALWEEAISTLIEDFLLSPWALRYPSPMAALEALHVEVAVLRALLSGHPSDQPDEAIEEVLGAVRPLGHRPALLQPLLPPTDGVALSLTVLRM